MYALTSYQHAHDAAYERASAREDAITAEGERIAGDVSDLSTVCGEWFATCDIDTGELLALLYASRLPNPPAGVADRLEYALRNLQSNINDEISRVAADRINEGKSDEH